MKKALRHLVGLCHRFAYASALALATINLWVLPLGVEHSRLVGFLVPVANSPVAAAGLLFSCELRGLDTPFSQCSPQSGSAFYWQHLRFAIPVYVLLFYAPSLFRAGRHWLRRRAQSTEPRTAGSKS